VVHHSASPLKTTVDQIRAWHQLKGFKDVGYHYVILNDGTVVLTRPVEEVGAHAEGHNKDSIGICVVGDNTIPGREWGPKQKEALRILLQKLPQVKVLGHRDLPGAATLCPGLNVRAVLAEGEMAMTYERVFGIVRAVLSGIGGYFVSQGFMDQETLETIIGATVSVGAAVWSWASKRK
jgi:N-acetylmuramoyl-L-alanine amidase